MQCNDGIRSRPLQTAMVILGSSSRANEPIPARLSTAESQEAVIVMPHWPNPILLLIFSLTWQAVSLTYSVPLFHFFLRLVFTLAHDTACTAPATESPHCDASARSLLNRLLLPASYPGPRYPHAGLHLELSPDESLSLARHEHTAINAECIVSISLISQIITLHQRMMEEHLFIKSGFQHSEKSPAVWSTITRTPMRHFNPSTSSREYACIAYI